MAECYQKCGIDPVQYETYTPLELNFMVKASEERWERDQFFADARTARIMSLVANAHYGTKQKPAPTTPKMFMPDYSPKKEEKKTMSNEEMLAIAKIAHQTFKSRTEVKKKDGR